MLSKKEDFFLDLKKDISKEVRMSKEINIFSKEIGKKSNLENRKIIEEEIKSLKKELKKNNEEIIEILNRISLTSPLKSGTQIFKQDVIANVNSTKKIGNKISFDKFFQRFLTKSKLSGVDKEALKRVREKEEKEKIVRIKTKKPSMYVRTANKFFSDYSAELIKKFTFKQLQIDLVKSNMNFLLRSYISVILFTTLISFIVSIFIFLFFLFFNISATFPIVTLANENFLIRFIKTFWIVFMLPISTFIFMYLYPSLEKDSIENKISQELPFATINMAAISGAMIEPTKIFQIIISTKEYPYLEKEFTKLLNSVNVLGQDFVSALRNSTFNTASKKLAELFNGLATTINSGGDLPKFFEGRAETMLFEYHLEKEKATKFAETFMDIYISVVIAAPMILMLLLMMMRISGLGISLSTGMITLIMILGVTGINIAFLIFLQLKQSTI